MAWRHFVTDWRVWRDIKACFAWTDWGADIGENFMVEKQSKTFIVHFCFHFKAYIPVYPAYIWSLRWVYAVKKPRRLVYGVYPRIPPNTPLHKGRGEGPEGTLLIYDHWGEYTLSKNPEVGIRRIPAYIPPIHHWYSSHAYSRSV